jgi:hypothetical protein
MATYFPVYRQPKNISVAASGDNVAIAGIANEFISVHEIALTFASAVDVTLKDGATVLGVYQGITSLALDQPKMRNLFVLKPGNDFVINLGAAVACKGTVWYSQQRSTA